MAALDPFTLLVAGAIFTAGLVMILMFSRVGLGEEAKGLRTWLVGDIIAFVGQASSLARTSAANIGPTAHDFVATTGFLMAALAFHWLAIRRHTGRSMSARRTAATGVLIGVATSGTCWLINDIAVWSKVFHVCIIVLLALPVPLLIGPARRCWGARMLATVFSAGVLVNVLMLFAGDPSVSMRQELVSGLLASLIISLLSSSALLLWCQEELAGRLTALAISDTLTGALNRRGLLPLLQLELARASRAKQSVSVVICDLDHFKKINDVHGHEAGDAVLRAFVSRAKSKLRAGDLVARWGGEEFLFVLPGTALPDAVNVIRRLQKAQTPAATTLPLVTFSAGVSASSEDVCNDNPDDLIALADVRLYSAKESRNCVVGNEKPDAPVARPESTGSTLESLQHDCEAVV